MKPLDFSKYSDSELVESLNSIDKEKYADNYRLLEREIRRRGNSIPGFVETTLEKEELSDIRKWSGERGIEPGYVDASGKYVPNSVPFGTRLLNGVQAIALVSYGIYGVMKNDLFISGKRGKGIHLHDFSTVLCLIAFLLFGVSMVSLIVDHYDKRNNEKSYFRVRKKAGALAIIFLVFAIGREIILRK